MTLSLWLSLCAFAQEPPVGFDADGPELPVWQGSGPATVWSPGRVAQGAGVVGAALDYGRGVLVYRSEEGTVQVLPNALELQLSGAWAPVRGLEVMASTSVHPLAAYNTAAMGDTRLAIGASRAVGVWRAGLVPWLRLPTASRGKAVGGPGVSVGGVVTAAGPVGPLSIAAHVGGGAAPTAEFADGDALVVQTLGGPQVDGAVAVGREEDQWAAYLEVRSAWSPGGGTDAERATAPAANHIAELMVSGHVDVSPRVRATAALGTGLTRGPGTSVVRAMAGASVRLGPLAQDDGLDPVVTSKVDPTACVRLETAGDVLAGTSIEVGSTTTLSGSVCVDGPEGTEVDVVAPGYAPATFVIQSHSEDAPLVVSLTPLRQAQPIRVTDRLGQPVATVITARAGDETVVADGSALELSPGTWDVTIEAEGLGTQRRVVAIEPGVPPVEVEVVLQPIAGESAVQWAVAGADGRPIAAAEVLLDGLPLGSTGSDGRIGVASLAAGSHEVAFSHPEYRELEATVDLSSGEATESFGLDALPGTVRLVVTTPVGRPGRQQEVPVQDAVVRFNGPRRVAPLALGPDGRGTQVLGPGTWQLFVGSARGVQQHEVVIGDTRQAIELPVVLREVEGGGVDLEVRVVDPEGRPLEGVAVSLDGDPMGTTSTGGALRLLDLLPGSRRLGVSSPLHVSTEPTLVDLFDEGLMESVVVLPWKPGVVDLEVRRASGPVSDAMVRFQGPEERPPTDLGPTGVGRFQLASGEWSALVASETLGTQRRDFDLEADRAALTELEIVMSEELGLGTLELGVTDPDGVPLSGVEVFVDELPLGATTQGRLRVEGLAVGRRTFTLRAPGFVSSSETLRILEGETAHDLTLEHAPTSLLVRVRDAGGAPVTDAVVRALGPVAGRPVPVDARGDRGLVLEPADWQIVAASPTLGMSVVGVTVLAEGEGRSVVDLVLEKPLPSFGEMVLRVVDQLGAPVPVAEVLVDGERHQAVAGGVVLLEGLDPGEMAIEARAPGHQTGTSTVTVLPGNQVRYVELEALPGWVDVEVRADGAPIAATLTWIGPAEVPATAVDAKGKAGVQVLPGAWKVVASAPGRAATRAEVVVQPGMRASAQLDLASSRVEVEAREVRLVDVVLFDVGESTLRAAAGGVLDEVANELLRMTDVNRIEVQGHADNQGDLALNQRLSRERAESVRAALVSRGVPAETVTARGYGPHRPIADNATPAGRAKNRRVEFEVMR